jgi:hypothetical protein
MVDAREAENDKGPADYDATDAVVKHDAGIRGAGAVGIWAC